MNYVLALGAILVGYNEFDFVNQLDQKRKDLKGSMNAEWGIKDQTSALTTIQHLLTEGDRNDPNYLKKYRTLQYNENVPAFFKFIQTAYNALKIGGEIRPIQRFRNHIAEIKTGKNKLLGKDVAYRIETLLAWDLERAAFLARTCYNLGYLDRETCENTLSQIFQIVKENFSAWEEYVTSFLLGRFLWKTDEDIHDDYFDIAQKLFIETAVFQHTDAGLGHNLYTIFPLE